MTNDNSQIRAYLANELSEQQRDEFEVALLEDPELYDRVYLEDKLRTSMKLAATTSEAPVAQTGSSTLLAQIKALMEQPAWSYAATCACAVLLVTQLTHQPNPPEIGKIVYVDALRSEQQMSISLPPQTQALIVIDAFETITELSAATLRQENQVLQQFTALTPTEDAQINLLLEALSPGAYTLEITAEGAKKTLPITVLTD